MPPTRFHVAADLLGRRFRFEIFPGLFSADRVDDGTRLLLEHLPARRPSRVLDLGCGYGALGLPIAAMHPSASFVLVDRDLLAVEASARNALLHDLPNVQAHGSLGYRDVAGVDFDWVLCNVPARIGDEGVRYMIGAGAALLNPHGELRVVVIRDLGPAVERVAPNARRVAEGARHFVYAHAPARWDAADHESLYQRDNVTLAGAGSFARPHDVSEDRAHVEEALPLLLEVLPRVTSVEALTWRLGYGVAPVTLAARGARVTAADRDLLATTFTRRNALDNRQIVQTKEVSRLALLEHPRVPLVALELGANVGEALAREELVAATKLVAKGGSAYVLALAKIAKEWVAKAPVKAAKVAARGAYEVWRLGAA